MFLAGDFFISYPHYSYVSHERPSNALTCFLSPLETCRRSEKYRVTAEFINVYGIGPTQANKLYNEGHRSLADLAERFKGTDIKANSYGGGEAGLKMEDALKLVPELTTKYVRIFHVRSPKTHLLLL